MDTSIDTRQTDWHYWPVVWSALIIVFSIPQVLVSQQAMINSHASTSERMSLCNSLFQAVALFTCPIFVSFFSDIRHIACISTLMCIPLEWAWYMGFHYSFGLTIALLALSTWGTILYIVFGTIQVFRLNSLGNDQGQIFGTWMIQVTACTFWALCWAGDLLTYSSLDLHQMRFWSLCATFIGAFLWYVAFDELTTRDNGEDSPVRTIEEQLTRTWTILPILTLCAFFLYSMTYWTADLQLEENAWSFNILRFFGGVGALIVFGWGYDYPWGKANLMKIWVVESVVVVVLMFIFNNSQYSVQHLFLTLWANFLADAGVVFTLCAVASLAHACETNTFAAFWFWVTLASTIVICSAWASLAPFVMVASLLASVWVVFSGMLPDRTHEGKYVELQSSQLLQSF